MKRGEAEAALERASAAYQAGDAAAARALLERLVAGGSASVQILLFLAHTCRLTGDRAAEEEVLDRLLREGGRSTRALLMKGDCRAWHGDNRAAVDFYKAAQRAAAATAGQLPADLAAELSRAQAYVEEASQQFRVHFDSALAEEGIAGQQPSRRFQRSLDILRGERQIFLQQPTGYYFPELAAIEFFDAADFAWAARVEAAAGEIRAELAAVLDDPNALEPFIKSSRDVPPNDAHAMMDNPDWSAFQLWEHGMPNAANIARCPRTVAALADVPMPQIAKVAPSVFFSVLRAGARITPHHGLINTRLVCHLPLVVPPGCSIRVGNERRQWEEGKLLIFDDSIEHEAWNDSGEDRVVLIFETWRPELTEAERHAVAALFAVRERFEGGSPQAG